MAIVKLNKLQRMSENMSQLLSNETHMPKNLYQTSSENRWHDPEIVLMMKIMARPQTHV
jgi:hypothetical protein